MTDYNTMAKLCLKNVPTELNGETRQRIKNPKYVDRKNVPFDKMTTEYIVLTEDGEYCNDFLNVLKILNLQISDLPVIRKKYYKKEFINKNWDIIFQGWSLFYIENTEEELNELIELENYVATEDWNLFELEDFCHSKTFYINDAPVKLTDVRCFKDYDNAFVYKEVPALIFEYLFCGETPAACFENFKNLTEEEVSYMSNVFNVNDIEHYFNTKYSDMYQEEIDRYKTKYSNSEEEKEPYVVFAFG